MKKLLLFLIWPALCSAEVRVYKTDAYGNKKYHENSYVITKDNRVIEVDPYGNKQYHKPQFKIETKELNKEGNQNANFEKHRKQ